MTEPTEPTEPVTDAAETDPPLSPAQEAAVRRALADAGGPEPMPGEIVDRLDTVIAGLTAERSAPEISHPEDHRVLPLDAAARRRRVRARVLLAAAAVVLAGAVGAGIVNDQGEDALTAADQTSDDDPARSDGADTKGSLDSAGSASEDEATGSAAEPEAAPGLAVEPRRIVTDEPVREVRAGNLREDLVALQHSTLPHPAAADYSGATLTAPSSFMCEPAIFGNGYLVGILYDGKPAIAAFREPVGETQAAEVLACGTGDVLHSTTLPATG